MQQLYILRHGQSQANASKQVAGTLDSPLSTVGQQQALLAGATARQFYHFGLIVSSPMNRALETAQIIAGQIGLSDSQIKVLAPLHERDLGELEGTSYVETPRYDGNYEDAENAPGIEPITALYARAETVLTTVQSYTQTQILIVCHNGIGRMLQVVSHHGKPLDLYKQPRLENAIIYSL